MNVPCLREYGLVRTLTKQDCKETVTLEDRKVVSIHNGVCDSYDLCGDALCPYYDDTDKGDELYVKGLWRSRTFDGMKEEKENERLFYEKLGVGREDNV
jgi:hypothetical protein